ncbi:hypothetical protein EBR77_03655, partial [bacterium]|nr:hypothetical protein [bacterium]
ESPDFSDAYNQTITKLADTYTKSGDFAKAGKIYEDLRWSDKLTSEERIELIKKSSDAYSKAIEKETNAQEKARLLSRKGIMQKALGNEAAAKEAHIQAGDLSFESGNLIFAMTEYSYADDEAKSKKAVDAYQASLKK